MAQDSLETLSINTIRMLSVDAVQKANSGHPGAPMGLAPAAYVLWTRFLKHNPQNPSWPDRDRFVLSAGHGSMLLYSMLYLTGYDLPLDQIKQFRQWGSRTPGHPERGHTPGVETTTGPLGQGFGNGVGMAIAEAHLAARYNRPGFDVVNHFTYAIVSDGDLMEGVASEAASLAGHLKLGKLIYLYDNNRISLAGAADLSFTEDCAKRFEAYGWHTDIRRGRQRHRSDRARPRARRARRTSRPSLILLRTHIGYRLAGKARHLRSARLAARRSGSQGDQRKTRLAARADIFICPMRRSTHFREAVEQRPKSRSELERTLQRVRREISRARQRVRANYERRVAGRIGQQSIPSFPADAKGVATRAASGKILTAIATQAADVDRRFGGFESIDVHGAAEAGRFRKPAAKVSPTSRDRAGGVWDYAGRKFAFRRARAWHGRGAQRHGGARRHYPVRLDFSYLLRLHAPVDSAGGADGIGRDLCFYPRQHRRRRRRSDASTGGAIGGAARHTAPDRDSPRRCQRNRGGVAGRD